MAVAGQGAPERKAPWAQRQRSSKGSFPRTGAEHAPLTSGDTPDPHTRFSYGPSLGMLGHRFEPASVGVS